MLGAQYTILVTDSALNYVGDPIATWDTIDVTLKFNEPSTAMFTCAADLWVREQIVPGNRVVILRHVPSVTGMTTQTLIAGPIEKFLVEQSDTGDSAGVGKLTCYSTDDMAWLAARLAYPDPALTPPAQDVDHWSFTGNGEVAIRTLIDANAGPSAQTIRQVPNLVLGPINGVGTSITVNADRYELLTDVARRAALDAGGLGFRTVQVGNQIQFQVYQPPDVSNSVLFGFNLGNMQYRVVEYDAPTATAVIVGAQGNGADRAALERDNATDIASWGRMEKLVPRAGTSPTADLQKAGDDELTNDAQTVRVASNVVDTTDQQYAVHYDLGSKVSVEIGDGTAVSDIVTQVHVQAWSTAGELIAPMIGAQKNTSDPVWLQRVRALEDQVATLALNMVPSTP